MKITTKQTYTGKWYELSEPLSLEDFEVKIRDAQFSKWGNDVVAEILLKPTDSLQKYVEEFLTAKDEDGDLKNGSFTELHNIFSHMVDSRRRNVEVNHVFRSYSETVKLKGNLKEETKNLRISQARERVQEKLERDKASVPQELVDGLNEKLRENIDKVNHRTLEDTKRSLANPPKNWEEVSDSVLDKKHEGRALAEEKKQEITRVEEQIRELENKLDSLKQGFSQLRSSAFLSVMEENNWKGPNPQNDDLPEEYVAVVKETLENGEGFKIPSRHDWLLG